MNILIVGAGAVGFNLAKQLAKDRHNITMLDNDIKKVEYAREHLDISVSFGTGTSYQSLLEANINKVDVFAALTNNDEVNLIACLVAKKICNPLTIARVRNPEYSSDKAILTNGELGADFLIHPERLVANAIVKLIRQSNATDFIEFDQGRIQLLGIRLENTAKILDVPLKDLGKVIGNPQMRIVAVKRREITIIPRGNDRLVPGDQIFIICDPDYLNTALSHFGKKDAKVENIMIIGGGQVGRFIAKALEKEVNIKIIESDSKKALSLSEELKHSLVLYGDGTDIDLLVFEGLREMDEFVAVTGDDEANVLTSLLAKHLEVQRTVTLLRKTDYMSLAPSIGMDAAVSKELIAVNAIQQFIRKKNVAFFAQLPGLNAEIIEFIASNSSKIIRNPLMYTDFPKNAIIAAVLKGDALEIPTGSTHIETGDKVVVFSLPSAVKNVEKLF